MRRENVVSVVAALLLGASAASPVNAADPVRGKLLYGSTNGAPLSCGTVGCHGPDPSQNANNIRKGSSGTAILSAINSVGAMSFLKTYVSSTDAADIAAYIVNPAAGTPAPIATLSTSSLGFGNQVLLTTSATMSATLTNTGSANLVLASVALTGTNPSDFTRTGTCAAAVSLAPTQSCSINATFRPTVLGSRSATISVGHNASPSSSSLSLSGSGVSAPTPAVGLSATSVDFGNQTIGTKSAPRTVSISNTGTATLVLGAIVITGGNAAEFAASNCTGASLLPGANCAVSVTFTPAGANARTATLSIPSNASGSPHGVALAGNGTSAPAPAVNLNPTSLAFGNQTVNITTAAKSITLTNSGNAGLAITSIVPSGNGFASPHNCPATLGAGLTCTISVSFAPSSATTYSGAVTVTSTASGSPHSVGLTGTGTAPTPTAPAATLSPLALDFGMLPLSTPSSARTVSLMNSGSAPLSLTALSLTGAQAGDYAKTTNCPVGGTLGAGSTCVITLTFTPTVAGARVASLTVMSNAAGAPTVDLKGMGVVQTAAVVQVAPTQVAFGRVRVGKTSDEREVRIRNMGTTPLAISSIATTGDFTKSSECHATLAPGKSCEVKVRFKPTATGSRIGELTVASNASGSPHAVKLSGFGAGRRTHGEECEDEDDDEHACSQATAPFGRKRD